MKNLFIYMLLECECEQLVSVKQTVEGQTPILKELRVKCQSCGTVYFLHIQEVKQAPCNA